MNWINVKDKLPEVKNVDDCFSQSKEVVVSIGDETLVASLNIGDEDGGWQNWYCRAYEDCVEGVTHWIELPKKPGA